MFKKILQILGAVFGLLILCIACFAGYVAYKGGMLDGSSKAYVDAAVPAIVSQWSEEELTARAAPQLMESATPDQLHRLFKGVGRLGAMKEYCGAQGQSNVFVSPTKGKTVSATYIACAKFENGDARIQMVLLKDKDDHWKIAGFRVDSPALLP